MSYSEASGGIGAKLLLFLTAVIPLLVGAIVLFILFGVVKRRIFRIDSMSGSFGFNMKNLTEQEAYSFQQTLKNTKVNTDCMDFPHKGQ